MRAKMNALLSLLLTLLVSEPCSAHPECTGLIRTSCQNFFTARKCGMISKCLNVWRESKWGQYRTDVSADCTYCLHLANNSRTGRAASRICGMTPSAIKGIRSVAFDTKTCEEISRGLVDLSTDQDDFALCNVLTHCRSHTFLGHLNFGSAVCDDCKKIVEDVRALVADNATAKAIIDKLNALVCTGIPQKFRDVCEETVKVHVPPVLELINRYISPQDICSLLGLCSRPPNMLAKITDILSSSLFTEKKVAGVSPVTHTPCPKETKFSWVARPSGRGHSKWTSKSRLYSALSKLTDIPSGAQCEAVLKQIRVSLKDPQERSMIKEAIDKQVCSTLPIFLRNMCENAVNEHFDEMVEHLDQVDLKQICAMFGMPQGSISARTQPTSTIPGVCQLCELVMQKLVEFIVSGASEQEITKALDQVCRLLPKSYQHECDEFVEKYGSQIVKALISGTAPELMCMALGLCRSPVGTPTIAIRPNQPLLSDSYCDTCKMLVTIIEHQLVRNETEQEVEQLVKKMCQLLPKDYVGECKNLVDNYLPVVLEYLSKQMSPEQVCEAIQLCSPKLHPHICLRGPTYWCSSPAAAAQCKAESYCQQNFRASEPETPIEAKCETLDLDKICESSELAAKCGKSKQCLNRRMVQYLQLVSQHTQEALPAPQFRQNCTVCSQLVKTWQLHKQLFGAPIVNENPCGMYKNEAERDQCGLVMKNRSGLFKLLAQKATDPEAMCKGLGLCRPQISAPGFPGSILANLPENVGVQVLACSEGPVYWCASQRNAEMCGTVNFCNALSWFGKKQSTPKPTALLEVEVDVFGVDVCAWGSVYWCQSEETARRCRALDHCQKIVWQSERPVAEQTTPNVILPHPSKPCEWGPSYYCSSPEKAIECGMVDRCWKLAELRNLNSNV